MPIPLLAPDDFDFPDPRPALAENNGLVCASTDLHPRRLLAAYPQGIFPWFFEDGYFYWFAVAPRAVLLPENLHIGRSLRKVLRNRAYSVTADSAFRDVIAACSSVPRPGQDGSWIEAPFCRAYTVLHKIGHAHSFECRYPDENGQMVLAGGFYGVQIGSVFFGESMFAHQNDASKIAFACAIPYLADRSIRLIDCQQDTGHLARFGSHTMPFDDFQAALNRLTVLPLSKPIMHGTVVAENGIGGMDD